MAIEDKKSTKVNSDFEIVLHVINCLITISLKVSWRNFQADIGNYFYSSINAKTIICQHIEKKNKNGVIGN
jgi:hypothetical protein